jgi:hypothetical protein
VLRIPDPTERPTTSRALLIERGGRAVAAAALAVGRERGLVAVRHLGHAPNWFDPEPPAAHAEGRRELARALIDQPGDLLVLEELSEASPLLAELRDLQPAMNVLPGPWTFRITSGGPRSRVTARRSEARRLVRRATDRGTPLLLTSTAQWSAIAPQLDELLALQARMWEGREADVFTGSPEGRGFVRAAISGMGAENRVRLTRIDIGGRLGAFHLSLVWGTRAVVYKTAFDRRMEGLPGLGWASLLATVDLLTGEGVRTIDLGPWGGAYKSHIADGERTVTARVGLSPAGRLYLRAAAAKHGALDRIRRSI